MKLLTKIVVAGLIAVVGVGIVLRFVGPDGLFDTFDRSEAVTVVHWSNGHLYFGAELPEMAEKFNDAKFKTKSGLRIEVEVK